MKCPFVIKVCTKCGRILVANSNNFARKKDGKYGFEAFCKDCKHKKDKQWRKDNIINYGIGEEKKRIRQEKENQFNELVESFKNIDINKTWNNCPFVIQVCKECNKILVANETNFYKNENCNNSLSNKCKECEKKYAKQYSNSERGKEIKIKWKENNPDYSREYYQEHKEEQKERKKKWRKNNKEKVKEYKKRYYQNHPEKAFDKHQKRRLREESQGKGITNKEQWYEMFEFFNWRCAYSDEQLNKDNRSIDHIIALALGGEHEIWNMCPMLRNLNSSKCANDMLEWYTQQEFYSEERLNKIYEWIEYARNKWGNQVA